MVLNNQKRSTSNDERLFVSFFLTQTQVKCSLHGDYNFMFGEVGGRHKGEGIGKANVCWRTICQQAKHVEPDSGALSVIENSQSLRAQCSNLKFTISWGYVWLVGLFVWGEDGVEGRAVR